MRPDDLRPNSMLPGGPSLDIPDHSLCELLRTAWEELAETDPMRAQIFWFAASQISRLQSSDMFQQLLRELPELGGHLCMWFNQKKPAEPAEPERLTWTAFTSESEYCSSELYN